MPYKLQDITLERVVEAYKATGLRPAPFGNHRPSCGCPLEALAFQGNCQWYEVLTYSQAAAFGTGFDRAWQDLPDSHYYDCVKPSKEAYNHGKSIAKALKPMSFV